MTEPHEKQPCENQDPEQTRQPGSAQQGKQDLPNPQGRHQPDQTPREQGQPYQQPDQPYAPQGQPYQQPGYPAPQGQPYQQAGPYAPQGQPYQQPDQPYAPQGQPGQPYPYPYPFPQQQHYRQPEKKGRVWPWILGGCLIAALLGLGGCVGCIAYTALLTEGRQGHLYDYTQDNPNDYDFLDELFSNQYGYNATYTLAEVKEFAKDLPSTVNDGVCSTGVFEVGPGKDIVAGLYYLEGSQSEEGSFLTFKKDGSSDSYTMDSNVYFFGNYFADLIDGDVIVFLAPASKTMHLAKETAYEASDPIESGCYRVGIDVPAGTYTVTFQKDAPQNAAQEAGVYVMNDLSWNDESIVEYHYLIAGGSHTITVKDGQYVELYEAVMVEADEGLAATLEPTTP